MQLYNLILLILITSPFIECRKIQKIASFRDSSMKSSSAAMNGFKNSLASGMAAACAKTLLAPFDTIKTMQQQGINGGKAIGIAEAASIVVSRPKGFLELYVSLSVIEYIYRFLLLIILRVSHVFPKYFFCTSVHFSLIIIIILKSISVVYC